MDKCKVCDKEIGVLDKMLIVLIHVVYLVCGIICGFVFGMLVSLIRAAL